MKWGGGDPQELLRPEAPPGIKFALGENVKQSNWDTKGTRFPNTRLGVETVLQGAFIEAREYKRRWQRFAERTAAGEDPVPPRRDLRLEALVGVLDGRFLVHCHCYRADEILMILRTAEAFGFRVKTLQHVLEGYRVAPEIAAHGAGGSTFADWWAYKIEAYDAIPHNAALMTRAGVLASINSDSPNHIRYLNLEAAKAVKYGGLSGDEALRLVTLNPARQLGIDAAAGSIEPGKAADLAFYNGHPLSPYSRCVMTLVDGEVVFEDRAAPGYPTPGFDPDRAPRREPLPLPSGERLALVGARIVPVAGDPIERGTLLIDGERIAALGADVQVPAGFTRVELQGLSVYPGLIDAGTHLGLTEIGSVAGTNDIGEIAAANPELTAATAFNPHSELVPVARAAGITAVVTSPNRALVSGQASLMRLDGWTPREATVADAVGLTVEMPAIPWEKDSKEERTKKLKELRELLKEAKEFDGLGRAPASAAELKLAALAPYATGRRPILFRADGRRQIDAAVELAVELGLKPILVGGREAWKRTELLKKHDVPVILGPVLSLPMERYDAYDAPFAAAARLHAAGVRFCLQTDDASAVRNLPVQAAVAAAYGLPRAEALRAVTLRPAEILGVSDRLGSLEPGKSADLIVTDGDPLEIVTRVLMVVIRGRPVPAESKHTLLYEKFKKRGR
jgi:imidazolonepropionase-like amidohydrolase